MAEGLVKFFLQRLKALLLHETETFSGFERQTAWLVSTLWEIGESCGDICRIKGDAAVCSWINEQRDTIFYADDLIDEFIIQMEQQKGTDRSELTKCFTTELQKIESRLVSIVDRMTQLRNSTAIRGDKEDKVKEGQASVQENPAAIGEEKVNKKSSHETEESQQEVKNSITMGVKETESKSREMEEGQKSSSVASPLILKYTDLPYYLQSCLMYCCLFPENYWIPKGKLIRLLVAEGLVQEKPGKVMEDTADENINILINQGMFQLNNEHRGQGTTLTVTSPCRRKMVEDNFIAASTRSDSSIPHNSRRVSVYSDMATVAPLLNNIRPRSLFFLGSQDLCSDHENWLNFNWAKFVRVLDLERTKIESLPDGVGDLIHLTYLGLKHTGINDLPARLGNLRALQTLDIRWCGDLTSLPIEILNLVQLRHIKMYKRIKVGGVKLPPGIERLRNILTLTGIHASGGIARELSNLIHLRRLGVMDVAEENAVELFASIMMMQNLLSLSLEAKHAFNRETLVLLDTFSPPPLLRKLRLEGLLKKIPNWIGLMENLTNLRLGFSHLSENPASALQLLPNLKILTLWHAYDAKQLGKEFCRAGGFPKLEIFIIASHVLEEWTELEEGALPSLNYLHLHNCLQLRMLPEGLQFVTTLKQLQILPLLDEHADRLKPDGGEENYKINHIPQISFIPMSVLRNSCQLPPCRPQEEGEQLG